MAKLDTCDDLAVAERHDEIVDLEQIRHHALPLRGSNASRIASPVKISRISMLPMTKKPVMTEPRRLQILFPLRQQFAERGRSRRQAEAEEVERGQGRDRAAQREGQEGQGRHHRVGQDVAQR